MNLTALQGETRAHGDTHLMLSSISSAADRVLCLPLPGPAAGPSSSTAASSSSTFWRRCSMMRASCGSMTGPDSCLGMDGVRFRMPLRRSNDSLRFTADCSFSDSARRRPEEPEALEDKEEVAVSDDGDLRSAETTGLNVEEVIVKE